MLYKRDGAAHRLGRAVKWVGVLALPLLGFVSTVNAQEQPNIVLVVADDMRWDGMSCAGNPVLKTPNLDQLAASGTRFSNAFVTTSICCVSRASILTGQYARRHGVHNFAKRLPDLASTYPMVLQQSGYYSGFIGKWGVGANDAEYFRQCAAAFDFWAGDMGQSSYWHEADCNYIKNNGTTDRVNFFCSCPPEIKKAQGVRRGSEKGPHPDLKNPVHAETGFMPDKIRSFLDQRDPKKPFCLSISFKAPHGPWGGSAPRFADDFKGTKVPRRTNVTKEEALRQPEFLRKSLGSDRGMTWAEDVENVKRSEMIHQQYRLIKGLDHAVGELVAELERRGLDSNTVIIFTADNGYFYGEHGFSGKWLMYEESLRVPLIIADLRMPRARRGQVCDQMALNIDLAPTVLELASATKPKGMQGSSLLPLLQGSSAPLHEDFFYEHLYRHGSEEPIEPSEGIRTRDWKYIVYVDQQGPEREELYDLKNDPLEMKNLAGSEAHLRQLETLRKRHVELAAALK